MRIYVAGPYSNGDVMLNIRRAVQVADQVIARGHVPFLPHTTAMWHLVSPKPYEEWLTYDLVWLECCDALLRIEGPSNGADGEVQRAKELGMPVFYAVEDLPEKPLEGLL